LPRKVPAIRLRIIILIVGCPRQATPIGDGVLRLIRPGKKVRLSGENEGKNGNLD
jgi:hypothetical protein